MTSVGRILLLAALAVAAILGVLTIQSGVQGPDETRATASAASVDGSLSTPAHPTESLIGHCLSGGPGQHAGDPSACVPAVPAVHAVSEQHGSASSTLPSLDAAHPSSVDSGRSVVPAPPLEALSISRT